MAGIGVKLNKIYEKNTLFSSLYGFAYSVVVTIAPMFLVIGNIVLMEYVLGFSGESYDARGLFAVTVLYTFIFSLLSGGPVYAVLSRYLADAIFEERSDDILPCFYLGLLLNLIIACAMGIPFCIHEYLVGRVAMYYVFTGFCGYISLTLIFYCMLYLLICKDFRKIALYFLLGMVLTFVCACLFALVFGMDVSYSMLLSLAIGFFFIACMEYARVRNYFTRNSNHYRKIFEYFKSYWELVLINTFYLLGLYIHNFVFWGTDLQMVVAKSFVCAQPYDTATFLALITNVTATIQFTVNLERNFSPRYKAYSQAVNGGRGSDIRIAKERMCDQLAKELMNLVRFQFIISVVLFLFFMVVLPQFGFSGLTLRIYPCLAAAYFIVFVMYGEILFLEYFDDRKGAVLTAGLFCLVTLIGSLIATHIPDIWYGIGVFAGALTGWTAGYARLRSVTKNLDRHIFCRGSLLKKGQGKQPSGKVYDAYSSRA
jgi:uncharacterized membrane protein